MTAGSPPPLSESELGLRVGRISEIAHAVGFVGKIEYRHVYSQSGGAQYGCGRTEDEDLLIVFAEAFDRDADPEDFSLQAVIAHERGHQVLARHPKIGKRVVLLSLVSEEILASLLGVLLCSTDEDREMLYGKAAVELLARGQSAESVQRQLRNLSEALEALL